MEINCPNCTSIQVLKPKELPTTSEYESLCHDCLLPFSIPSEILLEVIKANKKEEIIHDNYLKAYTEIPHTFIPCKMIHMTAKINNTEIKFLVDTGAQISILPLSVASGCGLSNIIDEQYSGELKGVGTDKIMGRIHYVELQLPCGIYPCGFTVCKNDKMVPILGIDMMRNLGLSLDFIKNKITFDNNKYEIPFE